MNTQDSIRYSLGMANMICSSYLGDLSDEDLMVRAVEGSNHIKWQLGHLLSAQNRMINAVTPGKLPELPAGFGDKFSKETAASDNSADFPSKDELMTLYRQQHDSLMAAAGELTDEVMNQAAPERMAQIAKTAGEVYAFQPTHWVMHAGQWAILRRKLGRPPLF